MSLHHLTSEYLWIAILLGGLFVWGFNSYRLGKFRGKKKVLPWVIGGLLVIAALLILPLSGCSPQEDPPTVVETITTELTAYDKMSNGTWQCQDQTYQYRLEISGRMHNAAADSTFVYLSNLKEITFDQAWKAAGLSSSTTDYFSPEEAVLVDWITE